jgi:magnesium transporter
VTADMTVQILVYRDGQTVEADQIDPAWLKPDAPELLWVDITEGGESERRLLLDVFGLHELAVEDALAEVHHPKIESYDGVLYLILHRIVPGIGHTGFETRDVDFFLGRNFLITVHLDQSRSIEEIQSLCLRHSLALAAGPAAVRHRIVDRIVDHYRPEVDALEDRIETLEQDVFESSDRDTLRQILQMKADLASLRRVTLPQRDAIGRLARREFPHITETLGYRFRDVYDDLVRLTDQAVMFQDRITGLLEAYLSLQSNRLNKVMKVLTVIATIFMPLTVLTGMYGMNVDLPQLPGGGQVQFWWVFAMMLSISVGMLWLFRRIGWL